MDYETIKRRKERSKRYTMLKSWYGETRAQTEIAAHSPQPVSATLVINELVQQFQSREASFFLTLESHWEGIAGEQFAAYAKPKKFENSILYLKVRHSALIRELTPSLDLVLGNLNRFFGQTICNEIKLG